MTCDSTMFGSRRQHSQSPEDGCRERRGEMDREEFEWAKLERLGQGRLLYCSGRVWCGQIC